jgi:prephenate dehydrogenase
VSQRPLVGRAAILGVGLVGGSLGLALRSRGLAREVVGLTRRAETLEAALALGAIDRGARSAAEAVKEADLVVLATPVRTAKEHLREMGGGLKSGALVTDVGSTKAEIVAAAQGLTPRAVFIGGHPIAGAEESGVKAARADLFEEATWVLTPTEECDPVALAHLEEVIRAVGARPVRMSAQLHDRLVAASSHGPHLAAGCLVRLARRLAEENPELLTLLGSGFRDATRIAAGDPAVWRDICLTNRDWILAFLGKLEEEMTSLKHLLARGEAAELELWLASARQARREM